MSKDCILKTVILCKIITIDCIKDIGCRCDSCTLSSIKYFVIYVILNIVQKQLLMCQNNYIL